LSGRFSARSFTQYSLLASFFHDVIRNFASMGMQSEEDASRAKMLGADPEKVFVTGNLKLVGSENSFAQDPVISKAVHLKRKSDGRCLLVAGSSHRGEEEILLDAFRSLKRRFLDFQMVLAPRHPQRFPEVERLLKASGMEFEKRAKPTDEASHGGHLLFDTLGDLQNFMRLEILRLWVGAWWMREGTILEPARARNLFYLGPTWRTLRLSPMR
jgi:3-deoxy-D-manno-octulosonic-acid transferase